MTIEGEDFILTPINEHSLGFDLELLQTINKGKENERKEFKNVAYALPLDVAVKKIIAYRISKKSGNSVLKLEDYIKQFIEESKKLRHLCNGKETESED